MSHDPAPKIQKKRSFIKRSQGILVVLSLGMLAGVLIWAKLRLVTDIPRSAYADPREIENQEGQSAVQDQEQNPTEDDAEPNDSAVPDFMGDQLLVPVP